MRYLLIVLFACFGLALGGGLVGCEKKGPAEQAGEKLDDAVDDAGDAAEDAADAVEDAVNK